MNGWNGVNDINHPAMISLALSVLLTFYPIHYKPSDRNSVKIIYLLFIVSFSSLLNEL